MKTVILALVSMTLSLNVFATDIKTETETREYGQYTEILAGQVKWAQDVLDEYIEDSLGCSKVRFNLDIHQEPGFFRKGSFSLNLTAKCTETFSDFKYKFYDGYDEDYTTLNISYVKAGKVTKKKFETKAWY